MLKMVNAPSAEINKSILFIDGLYYKGDTSTHAQGTDPKVDLGA